jgi:hypothetical protein
VALSATGAYAWSGDNNGNGAIDRGDTGPAVVCVQQFLTYWGYNIGPTTGGKMTTDVRNRRVSDHHTGDRDDETLMVNWLNSCVGRYTDNR